MSGILSPLDALHFPLVITRIGEGEILVENESEIHLNLLLYSSPFVRTIDILRSLHRW